MCAYGTDRRRGSRVAVGNGASSIAGTPTESTFPSHTDDGFDGSAADDDTSTTSPTTPGTTSSEPVTVPIPVPVKSMPPSSAALPAELHTLVEFFFTTVYPLPSYSFLHPQTTLTQTSQGTLDPCLAHAISAVASHFQPTPTTTTALEASWIQTAESIIWQHLESPTLPRLQALLLVVLYRVETGTFPRAFMLSSLAARAAAALRLNYERTTASDRETRRRVMWSLKFVERYFSMGLPEFELCPVENIYLDLPCCEELFSSSTVTDHGAYQQCVKLEMLRRDIMKLTRSLSVYDAPFPPLPAVLHDFEQHLSRIGAALPNGPSLGSERIAGLVGTPWLARLVLVYLSYHQCHCDLFRLLLRGGYREAAPAVVLDAIDGGLLAKAEALCLQHATAIVDILATLNQHSQRAQLLEYDTAICGYHATRVLLFIAQFSKESNISEEWALSRAELCMASLRRFFPTSKLVRPVLEEMRRSIEVFANRSATTTPSRLASPGVAGSGAGLSAAARVRQRLAIHSLLRQADFGDEEDDSGEARRGASMQEHAVPSPGFSLANPGIWGTTTTTATSSEVLRGASPSYAPGDGGDAGWQVRWFGNPESGERWDADLVLASPTTTANAGVVGPPPLTFPWLQRWEGAPAIRSEMM